MARYDVVRCRGLFLDKYILRFEKKCFGWSYEGSETVDEEEGNVDITSDSSGNVHVRERHKFVDILEFTRREHYTKNFLFNLTEALSKLISFIRRLAMSLVPVAIVGLIIGFVLMGIGGDELSGVLFKVVGGFAIAVASLVAASFVFGGLGVLWRKVFKIDAQHK